MSDCLTKKLERAGFIIKLINRIGPCDSCNTWLETWYNPESKKWLCEDCIYGIHEGHNKGIAEDSYGTEGNYCFTCKVFL